MAAEHVPRGGQAVDRRAGRAPPVPGPRGEAPTSPRRRGRGTPRPRGVRPRPRRRASASSFRAAATARPTSRSRATCRSSAVSRSASSAARRSSSAGPCAEVGLPGGQSSVRPARARRAARPAAGRVRPARRPAGGPSRRSASTGRQFLGPAAELLLERLPGGVGLGQRRLALADGGAVGLQPLLQLHHLRRAGPSAWPSARRSRRTGRRARLPSPRSRACSAAGASFCC